VIENKDELLQGLIEKAKTDPNLIEIMSYLPQDLLQKIFKILIEDQNKKKK
jgi:hypothetical protein